MHSSRGCSALACNGNNCAEGESKDIFYCYLLQPCKVKISWPDSVSYGNLWENGCKNMVKHEMFHSYSGKIDWCHELRERHRVKVKVLGKPLKNDLKQLVWAFKATVGVSVPVHYMPIPAPGGFRTVWWWRSHKSTKELEKVETRLRSRKSELHSLYNVRMSWEDAIRRTARRWVGLGIIKDHIEIKKQPSRERLSKSIEYHTITKKLSHVDWKVFNRHWKVEEENIDFYDTLDYFFHWSPMIGNLCWKRFFRVKNTGQVWRKSKNNYNLNTGLHQWCWKVWTGHNASC